MDKPICLITGATDGVGKVTATELARNGYAVVTGRAQRGQGGNRHTGNRHVHRQPRR